MFTRAFVLLTLVTIISVHTTAFAQDTFPFCSTTTSDSLALSAPGLDGLTHLFGSDTITYPHEFALTGAYAPFNEVFDLYLTAGVSDRWSVSDFQTLITSIMNSDTLDTSDDVFGIVWSYFTREDSDEESSFRVEFSTSTQGPFSSIVLRLYDEVDLPDPCTSDYGDACNGWSWYDPGTNILTINASPANSMEDILGLGLAHELAHLCWAANKAGAGYDGADETFATLAEYLLDSWRPLAFDISYDACLMIYEPCDQNSKYQVFKMWMIYLYETFKGNPSDPTDDLIYRWINSDLPSTQRIFLYGLAETIWDDDFVWVGGTDGLDRVRRAFANYTVAKFCNAPNFGANGRFGIGGGVSTVDDFGLFLDNCGVAGGTPMEIDCPDSEEGYPPGYGGCWNVRILPPAYELSDLDENVFSQVSGTYEDGDDTVAADGDGSVDLIDFYITGTDYVLFRAGEDFQDAGEHELRVNISGKGISNANILFQEQYRIAPMGWVIGYSSDESMPQSNPEDIVFVEPLRFSPTTVTVQAGAVATASLVVTEFGRSIKTVVVVLTAMPWSFTGNPWQGPGNGYAYEYEYGVFTPGASTRAWSGDVFVLGDVTVPDGGTLEIDAGAYVKIFNDDLAAGGGDVNRVEINVDGELVVNGTEEERVTFHPWTQTTSEDWAGIYFSEGSEGGTFDYCTIGYAEFVIDSYAPISISNSTIRASSDALISMWGAPLTISNSTVRLSNGDCIRLDAAAATISSSTIEDYFGYGVYLSGNAALNMTDCEFLGDDGGYYDGVGVYVENNTTNGAISGTRFQDSTIGISYYNSTKPTIDECVITENGTGIRLDHYSSPSILHCMTSASYAGDITSNGSGIYCTDNSDPAVGSCNISSNNTGVIAADDSEPDLDGYGANKFMSNSSKHVANLVVGTTVPATGSYWYANSGSPNYYPGGSKITGSVDYSGALNAGPNPVSPGPDPQPQPDVIVTGLGKPHPNPFNPIIQIPFGVASAMDVEIAVYDVNGRLVRMLHRGRKERGNHVVVWDGATNSGLPTASSVYFVRMRAGSYGETQKIVLLK